MTPDKRHGDKAYDQVDLRRWVREQGIAVRLARKGIESSTKQSSHMRHALTRDADDREYEAEGERGDHADGQQFVPLDPGAA
jgi:hypothetical protein